MTKADRIREYYREHPNATSSEVAEVLGIKETTVKGTVSKDCKQNLCVRLAEGGFDYTQHFSIAEQKEEFREYAKEILLEQIDILRGANRRESDSNQIRLNSREIRNLLYEVSKL
ncbi:TPA: hypothetical protein ACGO5D_000380 [Streptococcus suis]